MNKDDVMSMAREAGATSPVTATIMLADESVIRFASLVAAAEREACANVVLSIANDDAGNPYKQALRIGAEAIRARGRA